MQSLHFSHNEELIYFPDGIIRNLASYVKTLDFHRLSKFKILPAEMIHLHALQELYINHCRNIMSITNDVLKRLHSLMSLGIQYLTYLETLVLGSCSEVEGHHEALHRMTYFHYLSLSDLPNLENICLNVLKTLPCFTS